MRFRTWKRPIGQGETVKKLAEKIERDCGIKCDPASFRRTYAGAIMKSELSSMSWIMDAYSETGHKILEVGSIDAASELIKKKYRLDKSRWTPFFIEISGWEDKK